MTKTKPIAFLILCLFLQQTAHSANPEEGTSSNSAFSADHLLLIQGKYLAWAMVNALAYLRPNQPKTKAAILILSSMVIPLAENLSLEKLSSLWKSTAEGQVNEKNFFQQATLVDPDTVQPYENFMFNNVTQKELDAVILRSLSRAAQGKEQSTIMLYGEPGTGKTGVGLSLARWPQFQVYLIPSQVLSRAEQFKHAVSFCRSDETLEKPGFWPSWKNWLLPDSQENTSKKVKVMLVDDAEFFLRSLTPGTSNYHSTAQEELESQFRTHLGSDVPNCLWFFTSNEVAELEGDKHGALERRFKNQIWVRLPDDETLIRMLRVFTEKSIALHLRTLQSSCLVPQKDSCTASPLRISIDKDALEGEHKAEIIQKARGYSPDKLGQVSDNAVQLAINEALGTGLLLNFFKNGEPLTDAKEIRIAASHFLFFLTTGQQREEWRSTQAELEYNNKIEDLKRKVAIKELEDKLEKRNSNSSSNALKEPKD